MTIIIPCWIIKAVLLVLVLDVIAAMIYYRIWEEV